MQGNRHQLQKRQRFPEQTGSAGSPDATAGAIGYCVQLGAFSERRNAETMVAQLKARGYEASITPFADPREENILYRKDGFFSPKWRKRPSSPWPILIGKKSPRWSRLTNTLKALDVVRGDFVHVVRVGAFSKEENAVQLVTRLKEKGESPFLLRRKGDNGQTLFVVGLVKYDDKVAALGTSREVSEGRKSGSVCGVIGP